jgi:hypothetical protein
MAKPVHSNLDLLGVSRIVNLPEPASASEPATKAYVDSAVEGLAFKDSVRVATQSNVNLASPGATVDGVSLATLDRFLVRAQTAPAENGIYLWNGAAVPATRSPDASTAAELEQAVVTVEEGTSAAATLRQTSVNFTLGSGAVAWTAFGTSAPAASETTAGLLEIATQAETNAGLVDNVAVTPLKLASYPGHMRRFAANFGDGSATQYDLTHNLATLDVHVEVFANATGASILCDVTRTSVNVVRLNFSAAPTANQFRCVVLG